MPVINIIEDGQVISRDLYSHDVAIIPSEPDENQRGVERFEPAIVEEIEYDNEGQSDTTTTVCGESETRRTGDKNPDITMNGVVTSDGKDELKSLKRGQEITLISDVENGQVAVKRATVTQSADLVSYQETGSAEEQLAFTFQLELKRTT